MIQIRTARRLAAATVTGTIAAALAIGSASPAAADRGDLAPPTSTPTGQSSIIDFYNNWMFCHDTWLVSLDQMYPEGFSVFECMRVIDAHS